MQNDIRSAINVSHKDYADQFNNHYSKRDFHYRKVEDGLVIFTNPSIVSRLLTSFNNQYPNAHLRLESDYYVDENGYNIGYWFVE